MSLHTVTIDDKLEPIDVKFPSVQPKSTVQDHWRSKVEENQNATFMTSFRYTCLYTITNGPHNEISSNPILHAFVSAYNQHHDIILSPDDMWMLVCLKFADYVNQNAEQVRSLFVDHAEGKIELKVQNFANESEWDVFFDNMKDIISKNVKGDTCNLLSANFSTTGKVESILSTACIMHTFKPYFEYRECTKCICGIREVHFMGIYNNCIYILTVETMLFYFMFRYS